MLFFAHGKIVSAFGVTKFDPIEGCRNKFPHPYSEGVLDWLVKSSSATELYGVDPKTYLITEPVWVWARFCIQVSKSIGQINIDELLIKAMMICVSGKIVVHHQGGRSGMMADHYDERDMFFIIKICNSIE